MHEGMEGFRFEASEIDAVDALITTRRGGLSSGSYQSLNLGLRVGDDPAIVLENRRRVFRAFGLDLERSVWCRQVHANNVVVVDEADAGRGATTEEDIVLDADALVTTATGLSLCVTLADCVPVVIYDSRRGVLGLAHAGWGGTVSRIASRTVAVFQERFGAVPKDLIAAIGPSIGPERYEVGEDVLARARESYGDESEAFITPLPSAGKALFDLWTANRIDLESAGLQREQIEIAEISTDEHLNDFYSHRVEGMTGRFIAAASLRPQ
jgi:purine-nucleoside/S-methyl-5'-thioadenosine phosphorylase / adenosine deaminase